MHAALVVQTLLLTAAFASHHDVYQRAAKYNKKRLLASRSTATPPSGQQLSRYLTNKTESEFHCFACKSSSENEALKKMQLTAGTSGCYTLANMGAEFAVDGDNFPMVPFPIGESYAGELPIAKNSSQELFFWFFPSTNPLASDEIVLWLNGGPGCSSLGGLLQENGPFLWQSGTSLPNLNPYSWTNLTNMVWVDQPIGVGLSQGVPNLKDEIGVANEFMGFWKNFMDTFDLKGRNVYLTGESFAGTYVPYIAAAMLDANNTEYFNVKGIQVNDPSLGDGVAQAPAVPMLNAYSEIFNLNDTFITEINAAADSCGFTSFIETALTFPPPVPLPTVPNPSTAGCDIWEDILLAATYVNPCFNIYHIMDFCPFLSDQLDFQSLSGGLSNFFNNSDVQKALHAPPTNYLFCGEVDVFPHGDNSVAPALSGTLQSVIERTNNVLVANGNLDFLLPTNGTLIAIQNMTWNGLQGFQTKPSDDFFVPYHAGPNVFSLSAPDYNVAGSGFLGKTHTERGLTFCSVDRAGHEIPQYVPGASYRQLEFLLGRIDSLTQMGDFTTQTGNFSGDGGLFKKRNAQQTSSKPRKIRN